VNDNQHARVLTTVVLLSAAVFIADLLTPLGGTVWVLYLPIILAPVWLNKPRYVLVASAACAVLVVVGFVSTHPDTPTWRGLRNRGMGLMALALTAYVGVILCNRSIRLAEALMNLKREVEQHQQTERALAQSEERLRLAVEGAGMGTFDVNLQTNKVVWSETHFRMLGYEPVPSGDASREMWFCRVHPDDRGHVLESQEKARCEHSLHCVEYRVRTHFPDVPIYW
jgi:PAS domain-containing protein